jgi:hypothetical protein
MEKEMAELLNIIKDYGGKPGAREDGLDLAIIAAVAIAASKSNSKCKCVNQNGSSNQNDVDVETGGE